MIFLILAPLLAGELSTLTLSFNNPTIIPITLFTLLLSNSVDREINLVPLVQQGGHPDHFNYLFDNITANSTMYIILFNHVKGQIVKIGQNYIASYDFY